jgi:hypothetical protein
VIQIISYHIMSHHIALAYFIFPLSRLAPLIESRLSNLSSSDVTLLCKIEIGMRCSLVPLTSKTAVKESCMRHSTSPRNPSLMTRRVGSHSFEHDMRR